MARDYPARCPVSPVRNTLLIAASILLAAQGKPNPPGLCLSHPSSVRPVPALCALRDGQHFQARRCMCHIRSCPKISNHGARRRVIMELEDVSCRALTRLGRLASEIKANGGQGPILCRNVNDDESPRLLGADEGLISLSHGEQAADDYHPQSGAA
ncbi:hypothetical protein NQZ68_036287 [Dissostichus eleginoides]|nr:hypothetical protein NQZ68_036287 [Dissostichus eleginoides]